MCSPAAWALVRDHFTKAEDAGDGFVRLDNGAPYKKTRAHGIATFTEDRRPGQGHTRVLPLSPSQL